MSKFCENCGSRISENAKFCRVCGQEQTITKLDASDEKTPPTKTEDINTTLVNEKNKQDIKETVSDNKVDDEPVGNFTFIMAGDSIGANDDDDEDDEETETYYDELKDIKPDEEIVIKEDNINRSETTSAPVKATSRAVRRHRITEDEPDAEFSKNIKQHTSFFDSMQDENEGLYADEIAEKKKHDAITIESEEEENVEEGRRITNKRRARRQKERTYDESKHYKLKHAKVEDDSDPNYDGYYENIEPIDADEDHKNKINPKTVLISLGLVGLIVGLIVFAVNFIS